MIQRIQSVFLLLCGLGFLGQFGVDFATSNMNIPDLMNDKVYEIQDHIILLGLTILGALVSTISIFLYKNLGLQHKLAIVSLILAIFLPAVAFLLMYNERTTIDSNAVINDGIGTYLPILSIVCAFLAMRFIKKDENLVKSMDRLR